MRSRIGRESERNSAARQNRLSQQRRSEASRNTVNRNLGLLAVASLAVVFVLRASWLACATPPTDLRPTSTQLDEPSGNRLSAQDFAMLSAVCPTAIDSLPPELLPLGKLPFREKEQEGGGRRTLAEKESSGATAGLSSSAEHRKPLHRTKLAPLHRLTAAHTPQASPSTARITGIRVASRPDWSSNRSAYQPLRVAQADDPTADTSSDEGWLVSPDVWFVPEDREKQSPSQQEPLGQQEVVPPVVLPSRPPEDLPTESATDFTKSPSLSEPSTEVPLVSDMASEADPTPTWPVLPPKPAPLPEKNSSPEPSAIPEAVAGEPLRLADPLADPLAESLNSEGPLHSEPDFIVVPEIDAREESPAQEGLSSGRPSSEDQATDSPHDSRSKAAPLFAAPLIDLTPAEPPAEEQPVREPVAPSSETPSSVAPSSVAPSPRAPVQILENLPSPQPAQPKKEALPEAVLPATKIAPRAPVRASAPAKLFAPPAVAAPSASSSAAPSVAPRPSVHGAGAAAAARKAAGGKSADLSHAELFSQNCYPSAKDCAKCHEKIYDEWSLSSHAYAYVSPMFHRFEQKINDLSQGTVGTFCLRCHSPAGISMATALGQNRATPIAETSTVARDGVGCISCHRVNERYGKVNGERRVVTGNLFDPVYGGLGGDGVAAAIADKTKYKLKTSAAEKGPGQPIHNEGRFFDQLTRSEACSACHQVAVHPGIKLEVVWEQYRASPACEKGVSCQDCHMGRVPGVPSGYNYGPIAEVAGKTVRTDRKQSNHSFYGPGYSIAHPGIFPQHPKSDRWTIDEWVLFDWRAGWGTKEFEDRLEDAEDAGQNIAAMFPPIWREVDDRYDARDIIDDNLDKLKIKRRQRELVMENGSKVDGPFFRDPPVAGQDLKFEYIVTNLNEGHNLPTASLGAQPQLWANVVLIGPDGRRVWESGYTDSQGDLCDIHSEDVQKGRAPYDSQLFNLQTMFMITGATGTDREFYLPVNLSIDPVAQLRPGALPISVLNHPPFIRMESRSIAPLGKKRAKYRVPAEVMCQPGHYRLSFRMRSRVEPMYFMRFVGATDEMQRAMSEGILDVHPMSVEFEVKAPQQTVRQPAMNEGWMR